MVVVGGPRAIEGGTILCDALWPPREAGCLTSNDASLVVRLTTGGRRILLTGDIEDTAVRELLDDLVARAIAPEFRYQHRWQVDDLLIWDNRCVLHRGLPYDADRYRRRMHQTRVAGLCSSLDED